MLFTHLFQCLGSYIVIMRSKWLSIAWEQQETQNFIKHQLKVETDCCTARTGCCILAYRQTTGSVHTLRDCCAPSPRKDQCCWALMGLFPRSTFFLHMLMWLFLPIGCLIHVSVSLSWHSSYKEHWRLETNTGNRTRTRSKWLKMATSSQAVCNFFLRELT